MESLLVVMDTNEYIILIWETISAAWIRYVLVIIPGSAGYKSYQEMSI